MKFPETPFHSVDWGKIEPTEHAGERGNSHWHTFEAGGLRARVVEYSPGFVSDHYCARGHVLLVLEGTLGIRLRDGREFDLGPGMGFHAGDDEANPHLAYTETGARVFIVD